MISSEDVGMIVYMTCAFIGFMLHIVRLFFPITALFGLALTLFGLTSLFKSVTDDSDSKHRPVIKKIYSTGKFFGCVFLMLSGLCLILFVVFYAIPNQKNTNLIDFLVNFE